MKSVLNFTYAVRLFVVSLSTDVYFFAAAVKPFPPYIIFTRAE